MAIWTPTGAANCLAGSDATCDSGFWISESTAHAYTSAVIDLPAERAPGLLKVLRETNPDFALLDGTLAECDRVGATAGPTLPTSAAAHGVNVQVVNDPQGRLLCGCQPCCRAAHTT